MFKLPRDVVKKVVSGEIDFNSLPSKDSNELSKGYNFEDQARNNLRLLEGCYEPYCDALDKACAKGNCALYAEKSGKLKGGWVCREYWLVFPGAPFDSQIHLSQIGIDSIDIKASIDYMQELKTKGAKYVCINCYAAYESAENKFCPCGSDLFETIEDIIERK